MDSRESRPAHPRSSMAIIERLQAVDAALRPIIGAGGVVALYRRSIFLATPAHPWLDAASSSMAEMDLSALQQVLDQRDAPDALAAAEALQKIFHDLLGSLIGTALTERLLRSAWATSSDSSPSQDITP